ncbi:MAG: restriction endonuclease subunit S [Candidatus Zophobacter franzmannii]|nr:restriction endonuclease subunit S [Candidatus Zophobacter franzmannii]
MMEGVAIGGDINIIRSSGNGIFLAYYLNNVKKKAIARLAQGISVIHLYNTNLKSLTLSMPSISEQNRIADFILAIDKSIEKLSSQIDESLQFKKGLLQKMFV